MAIFSETQRTDFSGITSRVSLDLDELSKVIPYPYSLKNLHDSIRTTFSRLTNLKEFIKSRTNTKYDVDSFLEDKIRLINYFEEALLEMDGVHIHDSQKLGVFSPVISSAASSDDTVNQVINDLKDVNKRDAINQLIEDLKTESFEEPILQSLFSALMHYTNTIIEILTDRIEYYSKVQKQMKEPFELKINIDSGWVKVSVLNNKLVEESLTPESMKWISDEATMLVTHAIYDILDNQHAVKKELKSIISKEFGSISLMAVSGTVESFLSGCNKLRSLWKKQIEESSEIEKCLYEEDYLCKTIKNNILPELEVLSNKINKKTVLLSLDLEDHKVKNLLSEYTPKKYLEL